MAGFFGLFNFEKPGKGVEKNEAPKVGLELFFQTYKRKFWKLMQAGFLYLACFTPLAFILVETMGYPPFLKYPIVFLFLLPLGPATAGFVFILRCYQREEPVFLLSDFFGVAKRNMRQSIIIFIINGIVGYLLLNAYYYYDTLELNFFLYLVINFITIIGAGVFIFMNFYIYTLMITFKLKITQLYRNALLFTFIGLWRNLIVALIMGIVIFFSFNFGILGYIIFGVIFLSMLGFIMMSMTYPVIKRVMLDPMKESNDDKTTQDQLNIFNDEVIKKNKKGKNDN